MLSFIDVYAGEFSKEKLETAERLGIKIAPGHFSFALASSGKQARRVRWDVDFLAGFAKSKNKVMDLLRFKEFDFILLRPGIRVTKKMVRMSKRQGIYLCIELSHAMRSIDSWSWYVNAFELFMELKAQPLICSAAKTSDELRAGRDLAAIAILFGCYPDFALKALRKIPWEILEYNRKRRNQIAPGVEVNEVHSVQE